MPNKKNKKRKNPWIKRRAKIKFQDRLFKINNDPGIVLKTKKFLNNLKLIQKKSIQLNDLTSKYDEIVKQDKNIDSIIESLPIETLLDSLEYDKFNKTNSIKFKDILNSINVRNEGKKIIKEQEVLLSKTRIIQIELLQSKIQKLEEILKNE